MTRALILLLTIAACDEHGRSPAFQRCSPKWLTVIEQCEELCVDPDLLTTNTSCWRNDGEGNASTCEPGRFASIDGHRGCCVFMNARVEFVECLANPPPGIVDAGMSFPD